MIRQVAHLLIVLVTTRALGCAAEERPLTISEAVQEALRHSPAMLAARAQSLSERIEAERGKPVARPTLTGDGSAMVQGPRVTFPRGADESTVLPTRYARLGLTLEQPIYRPGLSAAHARYRASVSASEQTFLEAQLKLIRDVRKACLDVVTTSAMRQAATEGRDLAKAHLDTSKQMVEAGLAAARDVQSAEADLAEAEEGLFKAEDGARLAGANLNRLLGRPLDQTIAIAEPTEEPAIPPDLATAVAAALKKRPELELLRRQLDAASAGIALAAVQSSPAVSIRASLFEQTPTAFTDSRWYALGLLLSWPVLDGGKTQLDRRDAAAAVTRLRALLDDAETGIRLDVEAAWSAVRSARARITLCEKRLQAAQSALEISVLRYEQRSATLLEVSATRLAVTQARAALVQARRDLYAAAFDLQYACAMDLEASQR